VCCIFQHSAENRSHTVFHRKPPGIEQMGSEVNNDKCFRGFVHVKYRGCISTTVGAVIRDGRVCVASGMSFRAFVPLLYRELRLGIGRGGMKGGRFCAND
jgi:hypothetical protein